MASLTLMSPPPQMGGMPGGGGGGGGGGGAFSPLTLFECTITNATMLIDSMAARDLMVAFKIVTQLNSHLVEVMEPQFVRIADNSDAHAKCPPPPPPPQQQQQHHMQHHHHQSLSQQSCSAASSTSKLEPQFSIGGVKREYNSDDDCQILEDEASGSSVYGGDPGGASYLGGPSPAKAGRMGPGGGAAGGGAGDLSDTGELSAEWKGILRKAYRQLKEDTGSNVFDFSLPYSAKVNMEAASKVIDKALEMTSYKPANYAAWNTAARKYSRMYFRDTLRKTYSAEVNRLKSNRLINAYSVGHTVRPFIFAQLQL